MKIAAVDSLTSSEAYYFLATIEIKKQMIFRRQSLISEKPIEISVSTVEEKADETEIIRDEVRRLYNSLMSFKDNYDFHTYGFGRGYKYYAWM